MQCISGEYSSLENIDLDLLIYDVFPSPSYLYTLFGVHCQCCVSESETFVHGIFP
jgi:hypothetical protein